MTDHPITPPPELVQQWWTEFERADFDDDSLVFVATQAARWGADHELEACINYFHKYDTSWGEDSELIDDLRSARRPKPLSLKEQALEALDRMDQLPTAEDHGIIRRALEQLDD